MCEVINIPFGLGSNIAGTQLAPATLQRGLSMIPNLHWTDINLNAPAKLLSNSTSQKLSSYDAVFNMALTVRKKVYSVIQKNIPILAIGGDHSIALGTIAAILMHEPNTGIIWFDAHGDVNTEATSPSGNAHGMPVAALIGLCKSVLNDVAPVRLKPQNIFWVGARDLDDGEVKILTELGIYNHVYSTADIHRIGMKQILADIQHHMNEQGIPSLHLSFDIDGMDPSIVAATGTKVPNGLMQEDLDTFIDYLPLLPSMHSLDFVEYNPLIDDEKQTTGKWCIDVIKKMMKYEKSYL